MTSSLPAAQRGAVRRLIGRFRAPRPYRRPFERAHDGRPRENPRLPGVSEVLLRAGPEVCRFPYASSETTWPPGVAAHIRTVTQRLSRAAPRPNYAPRGALRERWDGRDGRDE